MLAGVPTIDSIFVQRSQMYEARKRALLVDQEGVMRERRRIREEYSWNVAEETGQLRKGTSCTLEFSF